MSFYVPQMPLLCNVWRFLDGRPPVGAPKLTVMCNLAWGRRVAVPSTGGTSSLGIPLFTMTLLVPAGTDIRDRLFSGTGDTIEVPAGTHRFYEAVYVDDLGKGFSNEHRGVIMLAYDRPVWPLP